MQTSSCQYQYQRDHYIKMTSLMIIVFLYNHILWPIAIASKLYSVCYEHSSHLCTGLFIKTKSWFSKPATDTTTTKTLDLLEDFFHFLIESKVEVNRWKRISSMNRKRKEIIRISNKTINQKQMKENKRERKTCTDCGGIWEIWCEKLDRKKSETHFYNHKI